MGEPVLNRFRGRDWGTVAGVAGSGSKSTRLTVGGMDVERGALAWRASGDRRVRASAQDRAGHPSRSIATRSNIVIQRS